MSKPKNFVTVFSGYVRRGPSPYRELSTDHGTLLGGIDFVKELASLDKRRAYYIELHSGDVVQLPGDNRYRLTFDPLYRSDARERLIASVGTAEAADRLEVEGKINLLALINSRPNLPLTLIVASSEEEVDLFELPKPLGPLYTD